MASLDLSKTKSVFFIGIGGIGISALAKMCIAEGMEVSGVNDDESLKTLRPLEEAGVKIFFEDTLKVVPDADLYIYSDAWLYRGPHFIETAKGKGKPVMSYFEALGEFAKDYKVIAITGTHGKTTTTAMVGEMMIDAGLDPTIIIGSFMKSLGSNFRKGSSRYLVVEADEYNRHFLVFHPFIGAVTNIEADHLDIYKDLADVKNAFDQFLSQCEHKILDYNKYLPKVPKLKVPGEHNRQNAALALAIADVLSIPEDVAQKSLENFAGTWRRLEKRGVTEAGTIIYDDYAHHPTEVRASIEGLKEMYPDKVLTIVFQPHLYSRTRALFLDFTKCWAGADRLLLLPIYYAREAKDESVSSDRLAEEIGKSIQEVRSYQDFASAEEAVRVLSLGQGDLFVTMGAGEAYKVADNCLKWS